MKPNVKILIIGITSISMIFSGCCINKPEIDYKSGNTEIGPEISYRSSSFWGEDTKDQDVNRVGGIGLGAFGHWIFCSDYPQLGFYSGLFYFQNGAKIDFGGSSGGILKTKLHYLTIPFTPTYEIYNGLRIEGGFDLSFLLAAKEEYESMDQLEKYNIKDDVSKVQLGFNIATSYTHEPTGLAGFLRYNGGLTTMPSNDYDQKIRNGSISIGIRYRVNQHMNISSKTTKPKKRAPRYRNK